MRKCHSRLSVVEPVIASHQNAVAFSTALDITIMSMIAAKERSEKHWHNLFLRAGIHVTEIHSSVGNAEGFTEVML
jgi:hypothetical protein